MFTKTRQLIEVRAHKEKIFISTPGYLYHYKPFDEQLFIHHKIWYDNARGRYYMKPKLWTVSEPRTGLLIGSKIICKNRTQAVDAVHQRLMEVTIERYHEAVLLGMANSPERKPRFTFFSMHYAAVEEKDGQRSTSS